jgi:hypothetical protein
VLRGQDRGRQVAIAPMVGGGGMMVSRVTEEREIAWGQKIAKCDEGERVA